MSDGLRPISVRGDQPDSFGSAGRTAMAPEAGPARRTVPAFAGPFSVHGGFTLLELLLVFVIFSLSIAVVSPYVSSGLTGIAVKSAAKKVAVALNHTRALALRHRQNYYARFTGKSVVVEPAKGAGPRKEMPIPDGVSIEAMDGAVVAFYPGGGSSGGVFLVKGSRKIGNYIIQVESSTGSVRVHPQYEKIVQTDYRNQAE